MVGPGGSRQSRGRRVKRQDDGQHDGKAAALANRAFDRNRPAVPSANLMRDIHPNADAGLLLVAGLALIKALNQLG